MINVDKMMHGTEGKSDTKAIELKTIQVKSTAGSRAVRNLAVLLAACGQSEEIDWKRSVARRPNRIVTLSDRIVCSSVTCGIALSSCFPISLPIKCLRESCAAPINRASECSDPGALDPRQSPLWRVGTWSFLTVFLRKSAEMWGEH